MKDIYKKGTIIAIILLSIIFIYSYFNVKGDEINNVSNISLTSSVTITKTYNFLDDDDEEIYNLDTEQIAQLKTLISGSNFTRTLSSGVRSYDKDAYLIFIYNDSEDFQTIKSIGNEYIEVIHQFNGKFLKVKNKEWKNELEKIISVSIEKENSEDIVDIGGKYLNDIEFGIGDSAEELVDEWGLPIEVDYYNGGLYLKYDDAVFYTNGYINDNKTLHYGSINAIEAERGFGINSGMTIDQSREYLGGPDARDIFAELKEFGEGIPPSTDYYYRDGYTISIPYDKDTKQIKYIRLGSYQPIPDIMGSGFLELSNSEKENYNNFIVDFNQRQIQTNSPISIMKLWIHARMEENYEAEWELYSKEEKVLGWDKEEHMKITKDVLPGDFAEFKNPINIEVEYSDDYSTATVSWEDKYLDEYDGFGNPFRYSFTLIRSENSTYRPDFRPMQ